MDGLTVLGLIAGTLTTISFLPQVLKVLRTRQTRDLSSGMFLLFSLGTVLWIAYGSYLDSFPIIAANSVTLVLSIVILVFKARYR